MQLLCKLHLWGSAIQEVRRVAVQEEAFSKMVVYEKVLQKCLIALKMTAQYIRTKTGLGQKESNKKTNPG